MDDDESAADQLNDETFGVDVSDIKNEAFHFQPPTTSANGPVMSVDELERQFQKSAAVLSAADLEAQFFLQQQPPPPQPMLPQPPPPELHQHLQQMFQQHMQSLQERKSKYDGLMSQDEQDFVVKVQLSHLASDETHQDDFYYRVYSLKSAPNSSSAAADAEGDQKNESAMPEDLTKNDPEKFQKLLEQVRVRPKATAVAFEGALGKIPAQSLRNPKPLVQLARPKDMKSVSQHQRSTYRLVLRAIERLYLRLIDIDELYREWQLKQKQQQQQQQQEPQESPEEAREKQQQWNRKYTEIIKQLWVDIHSITPKPESKDPLELLKKVPSPIDVAYMLSYRKGRNLVPRLTRFLPPDQQKLFLSSLIRSMAHLDIQSTEPVDALAEMEEYAGCVVYPFVPIVSQLTMHFLNPILSELIAANDIMALCRVKPGILFLTLLISRCEIIKQGNADQDKEALQLYAQEIYPGLFGVLQTRFSSLFPPSHILPSIIMSSSSSIMDVAKTQPIPVDDQYVWQFLAAIAAGATIEQQRVLVMETRNKIMETMSTQGQKGAKKVNIFLHALGLDASQLKY